MNQKCLLDAKPSTAQNDVSHQESSEYERAPWWSRDGNVSKDVRFSDSRTNIRKEGPPRPGGSAGNNLESF